jgi:nickel-dependent lactate racemase
MLFYENGAPGAVIDERMLREGVERAVAHLGRGSKLLLVPPDITRLHSRAGEVTRYIYERNPSAVGAIMPALGTHRPMDAAEITHMFGTVPQGLFREHKWRTDCFNAGTLDSSWIAEISDNIVDYDIPVSFNAILDDPQFDAVISVSQVVPHEVAGMAGFTKNIAVGLGGVENIHKSHFLGAAYGMERLMGRGDTPVRKVLNAACRRFLQNRPIIHLITVIGTDEEGTPVVRGFFAGDDDECYRRAVELSRRVNVHLLDEPLTKVVVWLDPVEYRSTWLGNKSIYRTRMAIADSGELIVLAPGVRMFGEDVEIDRLIRNFGYRGTPATLDAVKKDSALRNNLSAAAHLIHGSSEGRFSITYCAGGLRSQEVEGAGFRYAPIEQMMERYRPLSLRDGINYLPDGEAFYFISNPASGLWAWREKFGEG